MRSVLKKFLITAVCSLGLGVLAIVPVVKSDNGYVAGYVFFPLLLLIGFIMLILFLVGLVTITKETGPYLLLSALLLPTGFFGAGFVSKYLELGAYREQPMQPIVAAIANKVLFKKEATHEEIERFWTNVIGYPTDEKGGHRSRPGVSGGFRPGPENGHEVIVFSFRSEATEEEKNDVRERIEKYPSVHKYFENIDTTSSQEPTELKPSNVNQFSNGMKVHKSSKN